MSDEIKVDDLVMIVKPRPCGHGQPGYIFIVQGIEQSGIRCIDCGREFFDRTKNARCPDGTVVEFYRLKKIDPPAESECIEYDEEITA